MEILKELVVANDKCNFIFIKDSSYKSGRDIMYALAALLSEVSNIHYLCSDIPCRRISENFRIKEEKFQVIDVFSDPYSWISDMENRRIDCKMLKILADVKKKQSVLFIDSLSYWLYDNSPEALYRTLYELIESSRKVVALIHEDSHPSRDLSIIQSLASMVIEVLPPIPNERSRFCTVFLRPNGKVDGDSIQYELDEDGKAIMIFEGLAEKNLPIKRPDPTANLTFNLKLNDDEKANREKVQLPYVKTQPDDPSSSNKLLTEADFYEDEDPDDDLDI